MNFFKKYYGLILIFILSFWAIKPLFVNGFFPMHDNTQVARVFEMGKALKDGMFPVRWAEDLGYGYGYPIFNFYAPFAYYVGGFLTLLNIDALSATKIMMGLGILFSGIFMYLLAKEFWGEIGAVISSVFYIYAPYHAVDIFVRGDAGEFWAYAFIPLIFYGLHKIYKDYKLYKKNPWKGIVIGAIGFAGVILSHNLTAMMLTPFLAIFILLYSFIAVKTKKTFTIYYLLFTIFLGPLISAFYWLPAIFEMKYTNVLSQIGGGADFRNHFVCLRQLWDSPWGFGGSIIGCIDGLSFKVGKLHAFFVFASFPILLATSIFFTKGKHYNDKYRYSDKILIAWLCILGFVLSIFFTLEISKPIWESFSLMAFLQYPWRFLLLVAFFSSLIAGFSIYFLRQNLKFIAAGILIVLVIYFYSKLFLPQTIFYKSVKDYTDSNELRWTVSKISDEYLPKNFIKPKSLDEVAKNKIIIKSGSAEITKLVEKTPELYAVVNVSKESSVKINIAYFPAWKIFLDNKRLSFEKSKQGIIVKLPEGKHMINASFSQTDIEKIANSVSLISIIALVVGIIFKRRKAFYNG